MNQQQSSFPGSLCGFMTSTFCSTGSCVLLCFRCHYSNKTNNNNNISIALIVLPCSRPHTQELRSVEHYRHARNNHHELSGGTMQTQMAECHFPSKDYVYNNHKEAVSHQTYSSQSVFELTGRLSPVCVCV